MKCSGSLVMTYPFWGFYSTHYKGFRPNGLQVSLISQSLWDINDKGQLSLKHKEWIQVGKKNINTSRGEWTTHTHSRKMLQWVSRHNRKFCLRNVRDMKTKMSLRFIESKKPKPNAGKDVMKLGLTSGPTTYFHGQAQGRHLLHWVADGSLIGKTDWERNVTRYSKNLSNKGICWLKKIKSKCSKYGNYKNVRVI